MYKLFKRIIIGIGLTVMLFSLSNVEAKIHEKEVLVNITASLGNDNENVELINDNRDYGSTFKVSFDDIDEEYNFLYWIIDGVIDFDKTESNLEFKATTNLNAVAVFVKDNQKAITFLDHSGSLIDTIYIEGNNNIVEAPNKPNKVGYESTEWISIYGSSNLNEIEESSVFKITYFKNTENIFLVDVEGGTTESRVVEYNDVVEVVATIDNFSHWEEYGKIVSFDETYIFSALYDRDLKAISGNEDVRSLITISHDIEIRDGYDSRLAQVYLSDADELIEYGFIGIDNNNNETIYKSNNMNPSTNEYLGSFNENYNYSNIKAYIVVSNSNGIETMYSEVLMGVEEYTETFDNTKLTEKGNQYISDTFTGTNGVQWVLSGARREGDYPIDGVGIILREKSDDGYIKGTFTNGLNSLSFNYRKAFTAAAARNYKVDVTHDGTTTTYDIPEFGSGTGEQTNIYEFSLNELNFTNEVIIKIYVVGTSSNQATFDNFKWTESSSSTVKPIERINVFFDLGYETNEKITPLRIVKGTIPNEPSKPMREGYTFEGWYLDEDKNEQYDFDSELTENTKLYANWNEVGSKYEVVYKLNNGQSDEVIMVDYNKKINELDISKVNHVLIGWFLNDNFKGEPWDFNNDKVTGHIILYAKWGEKKIVKTEIPHDFRGELDDYHSINNSDKIGLEVNHFNVTVTTNGSNNVGAFEELRFYNTNTMTIEVNENYLIDSIRLSNNISSFKLTSNGIEITNDNSNLKTSSVTISNIETKRSDINYIEIVYYLVGQEVLKEEEINKPNIDISENQLVELEIGETFESPNLTATDVEDGSVDVIFDHDTVNIHQYGVYYAFYYAIDSDDNRTDAYITVIVREINGIENYYNGVDLNENSNKLKDDLNTLLNNTLNLQRYDLGNTAIEIMDRDPNNFNNVWLIYNGASIRGGWNGGKNWAKEHTWAKSAFGKDFKGENHSITSTPNHYIGIGTDLHNLRAINPSVNSTHSNLEFGERTNDGVQGLVNVPSRQKNPHTPGKESEMTTSIYYPGDEHIGDVARILLYMNVTWGLLFREEIDMLIQWHLEDPVDTFEIIRNEIIFSYQGNRNPFIDYPELAEAIYVN